MPVIPATGSSGGFLDFVTGGLETYLGYKIQRETIEDQIKLADAQRRLDESQRNSQEVKQTTTAAMASALTSWKPWAIGAVALVGGVVVLKSLKVL